MPRHQQLPNLHHIKKASVQPYYDEESTSPSRAGRREAAAANAVVPERTPWRKNAERHHPTVFATSPTDLGRLEDRYELHEEIARGGMASVHLGRSITPGVPRVVAIKQLHAQLAWNPSFVAMFLDEGRLAARVHHPNVVAPLDFVVREGQAELCLVMEYVHGETLSHLLTRGVHSGLGPSPAIAAGIMVGVLRGLQAAHEATTEDGTALEIVHRDVSPQNVMVGTDGVARVLDFGVARAKMQDLPTGERDRGGKPAYLAPEQIRFQKVDRRADLFSAGVVMWELLAGRRLFRHSDPRMVWVNILSGDIPPPSQYNPAVSPALDQVVLQAMERDRNRRFPTARAFAQAIIDAVDPASASEIGAWVQQVSGDQLARRARRVAEIMAGPRDGGAVAPRIPPAIASLGRRLAALWPRLTFRRRWSSLGLLVAALAGMAISASSSRALLRRSPAVEPAASAGKLLPVPPSPADRSAASAAPAKVVPPSPPAARVETGPRAETPPPGAVAAPAMAATVAAPAAPTAPAAVPTSAAPAAAPAPAAVAPDDDQLAEEEAPPEAAPDKATPRHPRRHVRPTRGGRGSAIARVELLNRRAMTAYARANFEGARQLLRAALAECASNRLQRTPVAALSHTYLGVVLVTGFKQPDLGVEQFRQALRIDPTVPLAKRYARPPVTAAFREAVART